MGKSERLRNLLCISRRRRSSSTTSSLDKKLSSPKHLRQCSAPPNQYFTGNNEQESVMGADQKSVKINTEEIVDKILPPNCEKELEITDKIVHEIAITPNTMPISHNEISKQCSQQIKNSHTILTHDTASMFRECTVSGAQSSITSSRRSSTPTTAVSVNSSNDADNNHTYERLLKPEYEKVEKIFPQRRGSAQESIKVYQKDFVKRKSRPSCRNQNQTETDNDSATSSRFLQTSQPDLHRRKQSLSSRNQSAMHTGDDGGDVNTISQSRLRELFNPESQKISFSGRLLDNPSVPETSCSTCPDCVSTQDSSKDYNWGWVLTPQSENSGLTNRSCSSRCNSATPGHPYINDDATPISHGNTRASEIDFTVTQYDGSILHFTVIGSAVHIQFPQEPITSSVSSSSRLHISRISSQDSSEIQAPQMHIHDRVSSQNQSSLCAMTPNLNGNMQHQTSQENLSCRTKNQAIRPEDRESRNNFILQHQQRSQQLQQGASNANMKDMSVSHISRKPSSHHKHHSHHDGTSTSSKPPHFQLSMASYAKLVEYQKSNRGQRRSATSSHSSSTLSRTASHSNVTQEDPGQVTDLCRLAKVLERVEECPWYWGKMTTQEAQRVLRDLEPGSFLLRDSSDPKHLFSLSVKTGQGPTSIRTIYNEGEFRFDYESRTNSNRTDNSNSTRSGDHPPYVKKIAPVFTCVVGMVLFYAKRLEIERRSTRKFMKRNSQCERCAALKKSNNSNPSPQDDAVSTLCSEHRRQEQFICYWESRNGLRHEIPVLLSKAVSKPHTFPSLQRLCRQTLNTSQKLWVNDHIVDELPLPNPLKKYLKKYPYPI
ncbi:uncharacterized protein LOC120332833 [Styela clava]